MFIVIPIRYMDDFYSVIICFSQLFPQCFWLDFLYLLGALNMLVIKFCDIENRWFVGYRLPSWFIGARSNHIWTRGWSWQRYTQQ